MRSNSALLIAALAASVLATAACGAAPATTTAPGDYTLGFAGTISGDYARPGIDESQAVRLAVAQANAAGDLGFTLGFTAVDDAGGDGSRALVENPSVVGVVGPTFSDQARSDGPRYAEAKLAAVSPSATTPDLTTSGFGAFFRDVPSDDVQGAQAADYLSRVLGARKVYSVNDESQYAAPAAALEAELRKAGVDVVSEGVAPTKDYGALAGRVVAARPDAVFYSGFYADLAVLAGALRAAGYTGALAAGDGAKDDRLVPLAGPAGDGIYLTCPCGDPGSDPAGNPAGRTFATAYRAMFGADPGPYAAEAYDAANAIIGVLKGLGRAGINRGSVLAGVAGVRHQGITKEIAFRPGGDPVDSPTYVYQVKAQKIVLLGRTSDPAQ